MITIKKRNLPQEEENKIKKFQEIFYENCQKWSIEIEAQKQLVRKKN
jgi:hypothetical protein